MKLHELEPVSGPRKVRKRVGRGDSSGWGRTGGRGEKGQMSRSGSKYRPYFEGGQIPLFRRLPKRGFNSPNHKYYTIINIGLLDKLFNENEVVDKDTLLKKGLVNKEDRQLKILANGEITKALTVKAEKFSGAAKSKIEAAGGTCELVGESVAAAE